MSQVVSFTQMKDGTAEDYALLGRLEAEEMKSFPDRVLGWLRTMEDSAGYQVSRLEHSLQAATRAHRAGEDEETVVCVLLHDIGDHLAPANHSEVAAAVLRPYVSDKNYWIVKHHGVFQGYYYFHLTGQDRSGGPGSGLEQPALRQQRVQTHLGHGPEPSGPPPGAS